jgi:Matrixin
VLLKRLLIALAFTLPCFAGRRTNWTGPYRPCLNSSELLKASHMDIGVRFDTANLISTVALRQALRFWATVLDLTFHEEPSEDCAIAAVDATPEILSREHDVARAQFTDWDNFQGWIAFDPHISAYMSQEEIYATAVHELGHIFGLVHSTNALSVMYYLDVNEHAFLDAADLRALGAKHALRSRAASAMVLR